MKRKVPDLMLIKLMQKYHWGCSYIGFPHAKPQNWTHPSQVDPSPETGVTNSTHSRKNEWREVIERKDTIKKRGRKGGRKEREGRRDRKRSKETWRPLSSLVMKRIFIINIYDILVVVPICTSFMNLGQFIKFSELPFSHLEKWDYPIYYYFNELAWELS